MSNNSSDGHRIKRVTDDPVFKVQSHKKKKVAVDSRFLSMFDDKRFVQKYNVDSRGRPFVKSAQDLRNFYDINSSDDDHDELSNEGFFQEGADPARGRKNSSSSDSSEDETNTHGDTDGQIVHPWAELDADAPAIGEATRRLAVCNLDWNEIKSSDLFLLFDSFCPTNGKIICSKIYLSELGKERLSVEEVQGPKELHLLSDKKTASLDSGETQEKLRQYELQRLRYYYAIIECDSAETASHLYEQLDGIEVESTSDRLDLRFVPEDMAFDDEPFSQTTEKPQGDEYEPPRFVTSALHQTKVILSWDKTKSDRTKVLQRNFRVKGNEISESDAKAFLASDSDASENEAAYASVEFCLPDAYRPSADHGSSASHETEFLNEGDSTSCNDSEAAHALSTPQSEAELLNEYKKLVASSTGSSSRQSKEGNKTEDFMEISWNPDVLVSSTNISDDEGVTKPAKTFDRSVKRHNVRKKRKEQTKTDKKSKPEAGSEANDKALELLVSDEKTSESEKAHYKLSNLLDEAADFQKTQKQLMRKKNQKEKPKKSEFEMNIDDPRFSALYSSSKFNIDPTSQEYRATLGMQKLVREKVHRQKRL